MANSKELRALITIAGKIDPSLQSAMLKASGESLKMAKNMKEYSNGVSRIGSVAKGAFIGTLGAIGLTNITGKMVGMASQSIKLASDLQEVQNVVDTTFGESAVQINDWSKQALKAFGLSELQAKQFSGTMGAMLKSSGVNQGDMVKMSENLTALAGDFASFYNLDHEEAFTKIRAGISGETEPLKQIGINMSVANLEAFALSKGIKTSYEKMDQASQTMLRYNYLLQASNDSQGDFAKTQGAYANQMRTFNINMQQLGATIGEKALPYLTQFLHTANDWAQNLDMAKIAGDVGAAFERLGNMISWTSDNSYWLIPALSGVAGTFAAFKVIGGIVDGYNAWKNATLLLKDAQIALNIAQAASPIGLAALAVGAIAGVAVHNYNDPNYKKATLENMDMSLYAEGGIASRPSIFGDDGAEMAIPLQRTPRSLGLLSQTAQILGISGAGGNNVNVTVNVYSSGGEPKQIGAAAKEAVLSVIEEYFGNKGRVSFE